MGSALKAPHAFMACASSHIAQGAPAGSPSKPARLDVLKTGPEHLQHTEKAAMTVGVHVFAEEDLLTGGCQALTCPRDQPMEEEQEEEVVVCTPVHTFRRLELQWKTNEERPCETGAAEQLPRVQRAARQKSRQDGTANRKATPGQVNPDPLYQETVIQVPAGGKRYSQRELHLINLAEDRVQENVHLHLLLTKSKHQAQESAAEVARLQGVADKLAAAGSEATLGYNKVRQEKADLQGDLNSTCQELTATQHHYRQLQQHVYGLQQQLDWQASVQRTTNAALSALLLALYQTDVSVPLILQALQEANAAAAFEQTFTWVPAHMPPVLVNAMWEAAGAAGTQQPLGGGAAAQGMQLPSAPHSDLLPTDLFEDEVAGDMLPAAEAAAAAVMLPEDPWGQDAAAAAGDMLPAVEAAAGAMLPEDPWGQDAAAAAGDMLPAAEAAAGAMLPEDPWGQDAAAPAGDALPALEAAAGAMLPEDPWGQDAAAAAGDVLPAAEAAAAAVMLPECLFDTAAAAAAGDVLPAAGVDVELPEDSVEGAPAAAAPTGLPQSLDNTAAAPSGLPQGLVNTVTAAAARDLSLGLVKTEAAAAAYDLPEHLLNMGMPAAAAGLLLRDGLQSLEAVVAVHQQGTLGFKASTSGGSGRLRTLRRLLRTAAPWLCLGRPSQARALSQ